MLGLHNPAMPVRNIRPPLKFSICSRGVFNRMRDQELLALGSNIELQSYREDWKEFGTSPLLFRVWDRFYKKQYCTKVDTN